MYLETELPKVCGEGRCGDREQVLVYLSWQICPYEQVYRQSAGHNTCRADDRSGISLVWLDREPASSSISGSDIWTTVSYHSIVEPRKTKSLGITVGMGILIWPLVKDLRVEQKEIHIFLPGYMTGILDIDGKIKGENYTN